MAAKKSANNWVLSPTSAKDTAKTDAIKASNLHSILVGKHDKDKHKRPTEAIYTCLKSR